MTPEQFEQIINDICEGSSLRKSLEPKKINRKDFFKYIHNNEDANNQYARATQNRADFLFEKYLEVCENPIKLEKEVVTNKGDIVTIITDDVQARRLHADGIKWFIGKTNPKKYGERIDTDITSGGNPLNGGLVLKIGNSEIKL